MITFLLSGIWHGASLTFIVWGLMQGMFLSIETLSKNRRLLYEKKHNLNNKRLYILFGICFTFILFSASEIFGRTTNINDALIVYKKIFTTSGPLFIGDTSAFLFSIFGLFLLLIKDFTDEFTPSRFLLFESRHKLIRVMAYSSIIILILLIGVFDGGQFIYFQF